MSQRPAFIQTYKYKLLRDGFHVFRRWRGRNESVTVQWEREGEEEREEG